jgi:hypothetical protein
MGKKGSGYMKVDNRSVLRQGQIEILGLLYKYRFGSRQLIAESLKVKAGSNIYEKLNVLIKHGFVAKRYDKSLRLQGLPAAYYLTPKGLKTLQSLDAWNYITEATIRSSYRDKGISQSFINHTLDVYSYTNMLAKTYPTLKVFTRRDMSRYSYFPNNPPDAFLSLKTGEETTPKRFFFDFISETTPRAAINHRIAQYIKFFDEGGWNETNSDLPKLLFLVETIATKKRLLKVARAIRNQFDMEDDIEVYIATVNDIMNSDTNKLWMNIDELNNRFSLDDL